MMPKSPDDTISDFLNTFPATNDSDSKELSMYQRKLMTDWLRSSLASVLLWASERVQDLSVSPIPELEGLDAIDCQVRDEILADCRSLLIEKAKEITKEITKE